MATRVAVLIDWQNSYKSARDAFDLYNLPNEHGNYSPYELSRALAAGNGRGDDGELWRTYIFRGLPSNERDPNGYAANRRQSAAWMRENQDVVIPRLRKLRYPRDESEPPVEKGVDVELAITAVELTVTDACDVAIIFSNDGDLIPAVEAIARLKGSEAVETASWVSEHYRNRLRTKPAVFHHSVSERAFMAAERCINYAHAPQRSVR